MFPIDFFFRAARQHPARPAIISPEGTLTYAALERRVRSAAAGMLRIDPRPGERVGICAGNSADHVVALLATLAAGKIWVPVNPRNGNPELNTILATTEPTILVFDRANMARLNTGRAAVLLLGHGAGDESLARVEERHAEARLPAFDLPPEATQAIKFTGGTTGIPKGVMQPYRAWNTNIVTQIFSYGLRQEDSFLAVAPVTHGTSTYLLPFLACGASLVFPDSTKPAAILDAIQRHRITMTWMPPTLLYAVMAEQVAAPRDTASLRYMVWGGAPMRPEMVRQAQMIFGPILATTYGQTEAPQIATFMPPADLVGPARMGSVGRASLLSQIGILDAEGRPLPDGEVGEVCIRGDLLMTGYWRLPEKTAEALRGNWLWTGDRGVLDPDGFLSLKDRSRDLIITGGFNVYPSDVENALGHHPAIYDCAVVGLDDPKWGEAVHAAVQLRPGARASEAEIISHVKALLDSVKAPKAVHIFEDLPRSSVGKVLKTDLRNQIEHRIKSLELAAGEKKNP
ncbi:AMP-binding protein [Roseomonas sp. GC11]|uniref:class I adenylate-forming enzyme family protein n=1 Tax=Roseomonas sp. GC11 TaxID=2950546 RepID=UPI00210DDCDD|nr:AMP-binding protein [Roseomonas sp. GC11]